MKETLLLLLELQELEKKIDMLLDDEPEEADPDTGIGEFILGKG